MLFVASRVPRCSWPLRVPRCSVTIHDNNQLATDGSDVGDILCCAFSNHLIEGAVHALLIEPKHHHLTLVIVKRMRRLLDAS